MFEVHVRSDRFKFNAAHFIAFKGFRERLHGHNYVVSLTLSGDEMNPEDGYLVDFGDVKKVVVKICKRMNEHFILPVNSDVLEATLVDDSWRIKCTQDDTLFVMPRDDVLSLPIVHSSAEELADYVCSQVLAEISVERLQER